MKISIKNLNMAEVILALYSNVTYEGPYCAGERDMMKILIELDNPPQLALAIELVERAILTNNFWFDYVDLGPGPRLLRVNLSESEFDPSLYDACHGEGVAKKTILNLRKPVMTRYENSQKTSTLIMKLGATIYKNLMPLTPSENITEEEDLRVKYDLD